MTKDPFAQYKLPLGLTEGVDIPLVGTPAVFKVRLPASMNEDFNMELMSRMNAEVNEDGEVRVNAVKFQAERKKMFFETCILGSTGLPEGMTADAFWDAYPLAAKTVFDRATELASQSDEEVQESLGKLQSSPNGKSSGKDDTSNTTTSSKAA
jgi:hypothetical protein